MSSNDIVADAVTSRPTIGSLFRQALELSPQADPRDAVEAVIASIDADDYTHYLRELLMARAASEISALRTRNTPNVRRGVSTKQTLIRDEYWPKFLRQRILTPGGAKFLAEATVDDLRYLAEVRRSHADELLARAEEFDMLAGLMVKAKVHHLEQLDASAASKVLGVAA